MWDGISYLNPVATMECSIESPKELLPKCVKHTRHERWDPGSEMKLMVMPLDLHFCNMGVKSPSESRG